MSCYYRVLFRRKGRRTKSQREGDKSSDRIIRKEAMIEGAHDIIVEENAFDDEVYHSWHSAKGDLKKVAKAFGPAGTNVLYVKKYCGFPQWLGDSYPEIKLKEGYK